jgi:hypothetical protein
MLCFSYSEVREDSNWTNNSRDCSNQPIKNNNKTLPHQTANLMPERKKRTTNYFVVEF